MSGWRRLILLVSGLAVGLVGVAWSQGVEAGRGGLAELTGGRFGFRDWRERERVVAGMRAIEVARLLEARREARGRGLPGRVRRGGGRWMELVDWMDGQPVYVVTGNANAAISTGADAIWNWGNGLSGSGVRVGVWDGGGVRAGHQEFGGRVTLMDGAGVIDHATHVAGTVAAAGVVASARGMAPEALIESYDWTNDLSEMASRGAATATENDKLRLSNHSYNYVSGWNYVGEAGRQWEWFGSGTGATAIEEDFGRYNGYARDTDALAQSAPYYLMVRSVGNDRSDIPTSGQMVALSPGGSAVAYDEAVHPKGDGVYRGGFDTIAFNALAKNVLTVGSVGDAVDGGQRDPGRAGMSAFSSWGPTDDGRIKPDVVANGDWVYSTLSSGNDAYGSFSGTSMAAPNATGSAALLVELYDRLFPGQAMRASTLKGLIIQTADDLGHPGPDYKFGWGLVNIAKAAEIIQGVHDSPDRPALIESTLSTSTTVRMHSFIWDGSSPIRATLCWTDPAGLATSTSDSRSPRLVNNLDLKLLAPNGVEHRPYVMPFVGAWTASSMDLPATMGVNATDSVEQVYLAGPNAAGTYHAVVSVTGPLSNAGQVYSLILSGTAPSGPPAPAVMAVSPDASFGGLVSVTISGTGFADGASAKFRRPGHNDLALSVTGSSAAAINGTVDLVGASSGLWDVVVENPDGQSGNLPLGFAVMGTLWKREFDGDTVAGWSTNATLGTSQWAIVTNQSHTPVRSWFAAGPATRNTDNLVSESIAIPADASRLRLSFWHRYSLESGNDGGLLEFSVNDGAWFQVTESGLAESITEGGYSHTLSSSGSPNTRNQLAGRPAWSGNSGSAFRQVIVALHDNSKYAGKSLRARWRLGTNASVASPGGWYIDSVTLTGVGGPGNQPPVVVEPAAASQTTVTGKSVLLATKAADDGGEPSLTYTWSITTAGEPAPVEFSQNGSNEAKSTLASFNRAGSYEFRVEVKDVAGLAVTSTVSVQVQPTPSLLTISPSVVSVAYGHAVDFDVQCVDQFGDPLSPPEDLLWSSSGGGSIDSSGVFLAQTPGGPHTIFAVSGTLMGTAAITVVPATATVSIHKLRQIFDGTPKAVEVITDPAGLAVSTLYDGRSEAPSAHGAYSVSAVVADPNFTGAAEAELLIEGQSIDTWRNVQFTSAEIQAGLADDQADPDHDGVNNLTEYALGADPWSSTPPIVGGLDNERLTIMFTRPKALPDVDYLVEASSDLMTWSRLELAIAVDGPVQTIRAVDTGPLGSGRRFLQLRVVRREMPQ